MRIVVFSIISQVLFDQLPRRKGAHLHNLIVCKSNPQLELLISDRPSIVNSRYGRMDALPVRRWSRDAQLIEYLLGYCSDDGVASAVFDPLCYVASADNCKEEKFKSGV